MSDSKKSYTIGQLLSDIAKLTSPTQNQILSSNGNDKNAEIQPIITKNPKPISEVTPENWDDLERDQKIQDKKSDRTLRERCAYCILFGLGVEILLTYIIVFFVGLKAWNFYLPEWLMAGIFGTVLMQSFLSLRYVLNHLFNKK